MERLLSPFKQGRLLNTIFLSNIFLSLHYSVVMYINSSYLSKFFSQTQVSSLYIIGAILNTVLLLNASKMIEKIGNYRFAMYLVGIEALATLGLIISSVPVLISFYFLVHVITVSLLIFSFDVFVEDFTQDASKTGSIRATFMTITNITIALSPLLFALVLISDKFKYVYFLALLMLIPVYYLTKRYKNVKIDTVRHIKVKETLAEYVRNKDLFNVFSSHFILELFYSFMTIYIPIYLYTFIGFSWSEIGVILAIALSALVIFEIPLGELADDKYGEKEFLTVGFVIMGLSTIFMSFITVKVFWIWAVVLFITRVGAAFVEVSTNSYFFKKVNKEKTDVISFFRVTRPISFIAAPLIATIALQFVPFQYVFLIIGAIVILGTKYSMSLVDTK